MSKPFLEVCPFELPEYKWETAPGINSGNGIFHMVIAKDEETGVSTRFMKFSPGAHATGGTLLHDYWEEVFVFEGTLACGDKVFPAGTVLIHPPGTPHGPFNSPDGMMAFEIHYYTTPSD